MNNKCIEVSFLKMEINPNLVTQGTKIMLSISALNQIFSIQCPRSIRNGYVNFFGQSILLPSSIDSFLITILSIDQQNKMEELSQIRIQSIDKKSRKNISLTQQSQQIKLYSTIRIINDQQASSQPSQQDVTQQDLSEIDAQIYKYMSNLKGQNLVTCRNSEQKPKEKCQYNRYCDDSIVQIRKAKNFDENITNDSVKTKPFRSPSKSFIVQIPTNNLKTQKKIQSQVSEQTIKRKKTMSQGNYITKKVQQKEKILCVKKSTSLKIPNKGRIWERYNLKGLIITAIASLVIQAFIIKMQN